MSKRYSGKQIEKAGQILSESADLEYAELSDQMDVLSFWRFCHEKPLYEAFNILQEVVSDYDKEAIYARRLKRTSSIVSKLRRFGRMSLKNMQDIGGCRAIVANEKKLQQIVRKLRKRREFKGNDGNVRSKDYLKRPKDDGYRSYHLVGKFKDGASSRSIEVQVRTLMQHYWATALEIVDIFTGQALKSNQGDEEWSNFFRLVSEQFAAMDELHLFHSLSDSAKHAKYLAKVKTSPALVKGVRDVQKISKKLGVKARLLAFTGSLDVINEKIDLNAGSGYFLLNIDLELGTVNVQRFERSDSREAESEYISAEKTHAGNEKNLVALVSAANIGDIKTAYPNFFADSKLFTDHLILIESIVVKKGVLESLLNSTPRLT